MGDGAQRGPGCSGGSYDAPAFALEDFAPAEKNRPSRQNRPSTSSRCTMSLCCSLSLVLVPGSGCICSTSPVGLRAETRRSNFTLRNFKALSTDDLLAELAVAKTECGPAPSFSPAAAPDFEDSSPLFLPPDQARALPATCRPLQQSSASGHAGRWRVSLMLKPGEVDRHEPAAGRGISQRLEVFSVAGVPCAARVSG